MNKWTPFFITILLAVVLVSCSKEKIINNTLSGTYNIERITEKEWRDDTLRRAVIDTSEEGTISFSSGSGTIIWGSSEESFTYEVEGNILKWVQGADTVDRILAGYKKDEYINIIRRFEYPDLMGIVWRFETFWEGRR